MSDSFYQQAERIIELAQQRLREELPNLGFSEIYWSDGINVIIDTSLSLSEMKKIMAIVIQADREIRKAGRLTR